jgi:hypothetical protein
MNFLRSFQFTAAPGVSVAGVISIAHLSPFRFNVVRPRTDGEIRTVRKTALSMKWKRSSESLFVGWVYPTTSK